MTNEDIRIIRLNEYDAGHCWQYDVRLKNLTDDMAAEGITEEDMCRLRVSDFRFECVEDKDERRKMMDFIRRHEWLGTLTQYTTHWFAAYRESTGTLSAVLLMSMPNAFSKMLGEDTPALERLISRGASISWSPKNLGSAFVMWSIRWMVENTQYRLFTAYSDPTALELGSIYQACNFYYLGQNSGASTRYVNPYTGKLVSDRFFRTRSAYKKYAKELGIEWQANWTHPTGMDWKNIPDDVEMLLREYSKKKQSSSERIEYPSKHKYAMVMGRDKRETTMLRRDFESRNKTYPYPKERGK